MGTQTETQDMWTSPGSGLGGDHYGETIENSYFIVETVDGSAPLEIYVDEVTLSE